MNKEYEKGFKRGTAEACKVIGGNRYHFILRIDNKKLYLPIFSLIESYYGKGYYDAIILFCNLKSRDLLDWKEQMHLIDGSIPYFPKDEE